MPETTRCDGCGQDPPGTTHILAGVDPQHDRTLCEECFQEWCRKKRHRPENREAT